MAVILTGTGGLFKRLGRIFGGLADVRSIQGGTVTTATASGASWATRGTNMEADAAESPAVSPELGDHWTAISSWRGSQTSLFTQMKAIAEKIVIRQVDLDASLPTRDLTSALTELIRQMKVTGDDIADSTVGIGNQTALGSPLGTLKVVLSTKNRDGWLLQTPFPEVIRFAVASDSQAGGTARNESVRIRGAAAISDVAAYNWPAGSGCNTTVNVCDQQASNSKGNLLQNSSWETTTTSNSFDNWVYATGAAGTNVFSSGDSYTGSKALKITGDAGGTLVTLRQTFDTTASTSFGSGGTPGELEPNQQYAWGAWMKRDNALSAGILTVSLVDGANAVVADVAGNNSTFTQSLTGLSASYAFFSGTLRTPAALPTTGLKLEIKTSTAIDDTDSLFIDDMALVKMTPLYSGGPPAAVFAGSVNPIIGDTWTITVTNTFGGFAYWLERFFGLRALGLQFPYDSAGGETIADSLIA